MNKTRLSLAICAACAPALFCAADDSQLEPRLNPNIEQNASPAMDYSQYPFLGTGSNRIELNGAQWNAVADKFAAAVAGDSLFSVVYLGDSHIQADFGGTVLRSRLTDASRKAGRGLVIPFKLASTNEPLDYTVATECEYSSSRLLKTPWNTDMPFTGIGIRPESDDFTIDLGCEMPFNRLRFFYRGMAPEILAVKCGADELPFISSSTAPGTLALATDSTAEKMQIVLRSDRRTTFAGVELLSDTIGTLVHSIGNNGATYATYANIEGFGAELCELAPDLVIVALGTNEAFGNISDDAFLTSVGTLIEDIRESSPQAALMLVSPTECYHKTYKHVKNSKGTKRRVKTTAVNPKAERIRGLLKQYAQEHAIPFYDHFAIAGGAGSASKMKKASVLGRDGVHFTAAGYRLWGNLLADALLRELVAADFAGEKNEADEKNN